METTAVCQAWRLTLPSSRWGKAVREGRLVRSEVKVVVPPTGRRVPWVVEVNVGEEGALHASIGPKGRAAAAGQALALRWALRVDRGDKEGGPVDLGDNATFTNMFETREFKGEKLGGPLEMVVEELGEGEVVVRVVVELAARPAGAQAMARSYVDMAESRRVFQALLAVRTDLHADFAVVAADSGNQFKVHRHILARSPTFAAAFEANREAASMAIEGARDLTVEHLLDYIYTGTFPARLAFEGARELVAVAHRFELPHLVAYCVDRMMGDLGGRYIPALLVVDRFARESEAKGDLLRVGRSRW